MRISDGSSDVCSSDLYANTRELAPIVASLGFAARIGCGFTSRIGAMRISEEIDALESMAIRPIPYLISTRVVASLIVMMPLFLIRSEEHTSELQSLMRISYAVFCLNKKTIMKTQMTARLR